MLATCKFICELKMLIYFEERKISFSNGLCFIFRSIRFNVSSETDYWNMSSKWLRNEKCTEKNNWDSHNDSTSTTIENYPVNETYTVSKKIDPYALQSASILVSLEDLDVSKTSQQVFI